MEPPVFPTGGPQIVRAAPGSVASLLLPLPFGSSPFHFKWSRAGATLDERFVVSDDAGGVRLTVSAARTGDSGVYTLQASNAAGKDTTRVRLEVSPDEAPVGDDPPTFLRRLQDLTVKVGTRTRFLVEIVSSTECKVTWYRNERRLMETERVALVRDGNFWCADVATVSVDDAGRWTCTAENMGGRASCSAHLNVLVPKAYKRPEFVEELRALLTEQGTVSLECKVVGVPTPVLRWFKDSREIKAGDVFALTANAEDPTSLGTYTCEAVNCMGRAYSSSKVHVVGRASREGSSRPSSGGLTADPPPIFTKELEDQFVKITEPLNIGCHIVVPPWPRNVVWYNKEGKIEPSERYHVLEDGVGGYMLEVCAAEWCDEGEWKCVATTPGGRVGMTTCYVSMDVPKNYRKPRFMENLQAVLTEEGLVSFECKVVGFPTPVLSWFKDGQELKPGDVYQLTGTNSLGSYCCIARNCMGQASSSAELTVEDIQNQLNEEEKHQLFSKNQAPKFLQGLKSIEAKIDEPFRFTIKVAIPPEPSLLWYRDDQPVDESSRCHHGKEERGVFYLDIQTLEFLDQAEWKCVAMNDFGQSVTSCFLKLIIPRHYKKPRFLENLQAILSDEGAVNLECKVIGVPQPVLKWYKDGEELKPGDIHRIISGQDGTCCLGTYTCEAQNCMGIAASSASLLGFDDSMKVKSKRKSEELTLQRNLSLSTIHEERTSQMYDTPIGDRTLDDKGEISFSFDGKEVSVSLYETPDLTEEEALQIVEMYADQLSENVSEHNVVELPPLRFVKETSTSGNLLMEAIIIDVSPEYFVSPEEDLRTEADIEDISIADENGLPQISLDQDHDIDISGQDYLEKTMALLSDEKSDIPKKSIRKKSDSQKSGDDFFSLSRDQSFSEDKNDDDTQIQSESDLQSFASARSTGKPKTKSSKLEAPILPTPEMINTTMDKNDDQYTTVTESDIPIPKPKRQRRSSRGSRRSSSGSEKSLSKLKEDMSYINVEHPPKKLIADEEYKSKINNVVDYVSKVINDIQLIERDIILQSELMTSAATASKSLEIINSLITPLSELHSIVEAAKESVNVSPQINSTLFNNLPDPFKALYQSLTIIEKCIDVESDNKTLVKKTCVSVIEKCGNEIQNVVKEINFLTSKKYLDVDDKTISDIESLSNEMVTIIRFSADTIKARSLLQEANEFKSDDTSLEIKHIKDTQKAIFELKSPLQSLLRIVESTERDNLIDGSEIKSNEIILNDMSASIQNLQEALEQIESLSVKESNSSLIKFNTEIIEIVMDSILKLRTSFEQLSIEAKKEENEVILKQVLSTVKLNLNQISSHIEIFESNVGKFDILQSENKLEVLQKMAQTLISFENSLPTLDVVSDIKDHMISFHKNLTKVLENVIESNEASKYYAFIEICDSINRINSSLKNIESHDVFSLTSISNALKIIQNQFIRNVFEAELNCAVLSNIEDIQIHLNENINLAEEISLKTDSSHLQDLTSNKLEKFKAFVVIESIEQSIAAITNIITEECTKEIKSDIISILQNVRPNLEDLKQKIASMIAFEIGQEEHITELYDVSVTKSLAVPLCELNENVVILNHTLIENVKSFKDNLDFATAFAQPLHEIQTTLEILQQEVISQYTEDVLPFEISENIANVVQTLQSCIVLIQEQSGVETADEMSTLEDVSGIKTTAEIIPLDLLLPTTEEVSTEQFIETLKQVQPDVETAKILHALNEHVEVIKSPDIIEFLDSLSEISDYTSLKSFAISLGDLHEGIEELFHPLLIENTNELFNTFNSAKLSEIAEPIEDLRQSLSVLDASNIPVYENIVNIPTEKIHSAIGHLSEFKHHLEKCLHAITSTQESADKALKISRNIESLKKIGIDLNRTIQESEDTFIVNKSEIYSFSQILNNFLEKIDLQQGLDVLGLKCLIEELYQKLIIFEDEIILCTPQPSGLTSQEIKLIETVHELENKIAVLEQYNFIELSQVSDIDSVILPQQALEIQTDSLLTQFNDLVDHAVNIIQDVGNTTSTEDLAIVEDFFKNCKYAFSVLRCLITKRPTHKKIIRLIQEFRYLQSILNNFKQKRLGLYLSEDINELLSNFIVSLDTSIKDIKESLIKIIISHSKFLFESPIEVLDSNVKQIFELCKSKENYVDLVNKFIQLVKYVRPNFSSLRTVIIEELQSPQELCNLPVEELAIHNYVDSFFNYVEEQLSHITDEDYKQVIKSMLICSEKHKDYKDIVGESKILMLLKCLSECSKILKDMLSEEKEQSKQYIIESEEVAITSILCEMVEPIQGLRTQLKFVQDQILSGADEESVSIDVSSAESYVKTLNDINRDVLQLLQSENTIIDETDLPLIEDLDYEIHSIQENVQLVENTAFADVAKQISLPLEDIEKSLHLAKEKVNTKNKMSKELGESLLKHIEKYVEFVEIIEEDSAIITIDNFLETVNIARELHESMDDATKTQREMDICFKISNEQEMLMNKLHTALCNFQVQALESVLEMAPSVNDRKHVIEVISSLQADLRAIIGIQVVTLESPENRHEVLDSSESSERLSLMLEENKNLAESEQNVEGEIAPTADISEHSSNILIETKLIPKDFETEEFQQSLLVTETDILAAPENGEMCEIMKYKTSTSDESVLLVETETETHTEPLNAVKDELHSEEILSIKDKVLSTDFTSDQPHDIENVDSLKKLEMLLNEINTHVNASLTTGNVDNTELLRNVLDEVQTVIIKLRRDFDGVVNDTLNEALEDLECSVRSVQLQIDEDSVPELLKDACATLQLLFTNMTTIMDSVTRSPIDKTANVLLQTCSEETEQTIKLLDDVSKAKDGQLNEDHLIHIISKFKLLKETLNSLSLNFREDESTLIYNGIDVIQTLNKLEEQIFALEKDIESVEVSKADTIDSIVLAVHIVYQNISNMRSTLASIQKEYMYENYGKPSEKFLRSLKNIVVLSECDKKSNWKHFGKVLRQVLNHFEDIKFYVNFDKTARIPSDAAFTKIILDELVKHLNEVVLANVLELYPAAADSVYIVLEDVKQIIRTLESRSTIEVKEKIPIFKNISDKVFTLIEAIKETAKKNITENLSESSVKLEDNDIFEEPKEVPSDVLEQFSTEITTEYVSQSNIVNDKEQILIPEIEESHSSTTLQVIETNITPETEDANISEKDSILPYEYKEIKDQLEEPQPSTSSKLVTADDELLKTMTNIDEVKDFKIPASDIEETIIENKNEGYNLEEKEKETNKKTLLDKFDSQNQADVKHEDYVQKTDNIQCEDLLLGEEVLLKSEIDEHIFYKDKPNVEEEISDDKSEVTVETIEEDKKNEFKQKLQSVEEKQIEQGICEKEIESLDSKSKNEEDKLCMLKKSQDEENKRTEEVHVETTYSQDRILDTDKELLKEQEEIVTKDKDKEEFCTTQNIDIKPPDKEAGIQKENQAFKTQTTQDEETNRLVNEKHDTQSECLLDETAPQLQSNEEELTVKEDKEKLCFELKTNNEEIKRLDEGEIHQTESEVVETTHIMDEEELYLNNNKQKAEQQRQTEIKRLQEEREEAGIEIREEEKLHIEKEQQDAEGIIPLDENDKVLKQQKIIEELIKDDHKIEKNDMEEAASEIKHDVVELKREELEKILHVEKEIEDAESQCLKEEKVKELGQIQVNVKEDILCLDNDKQDADKKHHEEKRLQQGHEEVETECKEQEKLRIEPEQHEASKEHLDKMLGEEVNAFEEKEINLLDKEKQDTEKDRQVQEQMAMTYKDEEELKQNEQEIMLRTDQEKQEIQSGCVDKDERDKKGKEFEKPKCNIEEKKEPIDKEHRDGDKICQGEVDKLVKQKEEGDMKLKEDDKLRFEQERHIPENKLMEEEMRISKEKYAAEMQSIEEETKRLEKGKLDVENECEVKKVMTEVKEEEMSIKQEEQKEKLLSEPEIKDEDKLLLKEELKEIKVKHSKEEEKLPREEEISDAHKERQDKEETIKEEQKEMEKKHIDEEKIRFEQENQNAQNKYLKEEARIQKEMQTIAAHAIEDQEKSMFDKEKLDADNDSEVKKEELQYTKQQEEEEKTQQKKWQDQQREDRKEEAHTKEITRNIEEQKLSLDNEKQDANKKQEDEKTRLKNEQKGVEEKRIQEEQIDETHRDLEDKTRIQKRKQDAEQEEAEEKLQIKLEHRGEESKCLTEIEQDLKEKKDAESKGSVEEEKPRLDNEKEDAGTRHQEEVKQVEKHKEEVKSKLKEKVKLQIEQEITEKKCLDEEARIQKEKKVTETQPIEEKQKNQIQIDKQLIEEKELKINLEEGIQKEEKSVDVEKNDRKETEDVEITISVEENLQLDKKNGKIGDEKHQDEKVRLKKENEEAEIKCIEGKKEQQEADKMYLKEEAINQKEKQATEVQVIKDEMENQLETEITLKRKIQEVKPHSELENEDQEIKLSKEKLANKEVEIKCSLDNEKQRLDEEKQDIDKLGQDDEKRLQKDQNVVQETPILQEGLHTEQEQHDVINEEERNRLDNKTKDVKNELQVEEQKVQEEKEEEDIKRKEQEKRLSTEQEKKDEERKLLDEKEKVQKKKKPEETKCVKEEQKICLDQKTQDADKKLEDQIVSVQNQEEEAERIRKTENKVQEPQDAEKKSLDEEEKVQKEKQAMEKIIKKEEKKQLKKMKQEAEKERQAEEEKVKMENKAIELKQKEQEEELRIEQIKDEEKKRLEEVQIEREVFETKSSTECEKYRKDKKEQDVDISHKDEEGAFQKAKQDKEREHQVQEEKTLEEKEEAKLKRKEREDTLKVEQKEREEGDEKDQKEKEDAKLKLVTDATKDRKGNIENQGVDKKRQEEGKLLNEKEGIELKNKDEEKILSVQEKQDEDQKGMSKEIGIEKETEAAETQVIEAEQKNKIEKELEEELKTKEQKKSLPIDQEKKDEKIYQDEEVRDPKEKKLDKTHKDDKKQKKKETISEKKETKRKKSDEKLLQKKPELEEFRQNGEVKMKKELQTEKDKETLKHKDEKTILGGKIQDGNDYIELKHKDENKSKEILHLEERKQDDYFESQICDDAMKLPKKQYIAVAIKEGVKQGEVEKPIHTSDDRDIEHRQKSLKLNGSIEKHRVGEIDVTSLTSSLNGQKRAGKDRNPIINYNESTIIGLEMYAPPGYIEKSNTENNDIAILELDTASKLPTIYKAQTYQAQVRSLTPQQYSAGRSSESIERGLDTRQRSKARSDTKSTIIEKRFDTSRELRDKRRPVFSTYLTDRTAVESSRVKLTCSVLSSIDPTITWFKNGVLLNDKHKYRTKFVDGLITLEVLNAVPSDSAEYTCTVQNESGTVSTSANLKVYPSFEASPIPPTFTRSIRDTYHLAENELILECRIRGQPLPTITWFKDDRSICSDERYQAYYLADGVCRLAINAPTVADSGKYTCKAENSMWSDQITHIVNFTGKESHLGPNLTTVERSRFNRQVLESRRPHFTNVLSDYKVTRGGTIGLQVEIKGSPTRVEWLREGRSVTEIYRNAQTFVEHGLYTLALTDVTEKETGLYTCRAWSTHGNVDMNAAITVVHPNELEGKPAIIVGRPQKDMLISVGEDLNISFRVQGEPKPKVLFMKGIRDITTSQRVCKMTSDDYVKFTLKRSVISDTGTYCILARNAYGCDRAFVTVEIRQRASSENLISDWTYPLDDPAISIQERKYKSVPDRIPSEPSVVDGGNNWISLAWSKPDHQESAPVLAYKVESWLIGKEGGARWVELGITPLTSFDAFNLKQGEEYHFRVTPRNRYGWGEPVQTSTAIGIGLAGDRPEFTEILPGQLKVLVGETAKLNCSFKGKPIPEIVWMKNGHELEDLNGRLETLLNGFDCCLTIRDVQIEDEARYSCEASNVHGRASTYARMAVITDRLVWEADAKLKRERSAGVEGEYPPQFTMRLRDRRVQATYPVRLTCQVIGSPPPSLVWFKDGQELPSDSRRNQSQDEHFHTLEIAPTSLEDGGVYEAMARNGSGAVSCRCSLVVDKGIRAYVSPEFCCGLEPLYRLHEGEELRISAIVEAYPSVGVTWYRDGVRLRPSRRAIMTLDHDGQIELALASVTCRDAGVFTCTASNEVGQATTSGKVEVIAGNQTEEKTRTPPVVISPDVPYSKEPMFLRKPRSSEAREGDTVIIECEVIGDPKPDVYWLRDFLKPDYYRDANHFKRVDAGPEYRFEIPHAKLDFTGTYSVVARNTHGEAKAIISLQILAKDITSSDDAHNVRYGRVEVIPRFDKDLTDLLCYDGDAVEFECRVSGNPEPYIKWFHYNEVVHDCPDFETSFEDGTARLKIKQVTAEDEGTYTCKASNSLGKAKSSACLVVYPPGEPNTLSQRLRRPPALLSAASTPRSTPRATPARSMSRTPGPDARRLCSPSREIAPKFYTYPFNKVVEEGERVVFKCAVKGLPNPWATWDKDGIVITPTSRITIREKDEILRILEIEEVTIEDVGLYRITLENDYGRAEASARLEVITRKGKFYGGIRSCSASPRRTLYRRRTPSTSRQD